ncbi:CotH kinase family protein [Rhodococcus sp. OK519]|uniref:CotH kinase family protein n=1 Tax=Rhodococcus sp. OK519 TaxID=2135729 RepID=UPI0015E76BC2
MAITLTGGADPTTKDTYIPGTYTITDTDGGVIHSGGIKLRGRGNSTWAAPKKPWRINFDASTAPLGMTVKQKNWGLLAEYYDALKISNVLTYEIGRRLSFEWTPQVRTVELVLNGTYRGLYDLADLVRLEAGRLTGDAPTEAGDGSDGVWLMEIANKEGPNGDRPLVPGVATPVYGNWAAYDTPEAPTAPQLAYITAAFRAFEQPLAEGRWAAWKGHADAMSFADWYLIYELFAPGTDSALGTSCKIWKAADAAGGKFSMGPLWDFDLGWGTGWNNSPPSYNVFATRVGNWWSRMWQDAAFRALLQQRWTVLMDAIDELGGVAELIDSAVDKRTRALRDDNTVWEQRVFTPFEADARKRYILARIEWLGSQINAPIDPVTASVESLV